MLLVIQQLLQQALKNAIQKQLLPGFSVASLSNKDKREIPLSLISVEISDKEEFGDYNSNLPFKIAKLSNVAPEKVGSILTSELRQIPQGNNFFSQIEATKGYINFYLSPDYLLQSLQTILRQRDRYGYVIPKTGRNLVIDYSSPNIAKSFGIGHLRSTVIGQALYNLYSYRGWKCIGDNHLGDWGTQFGILIYQINKLIEGKNRRDQKEILQNLTIKDLERMYVEFHKQLEENPQLKEQAKEWFRRLEKREKKALQIWKLCLSLSLREFNRIYKLLSIKFDYSIGESFYSRKARILLREIQKKGLAKKSEGALIMEFPDSNLPPALLLKSDGSTTYFLRDLAAVKYRLKKWHPKMIIYEVGADQSLHFRQLFQAVKLLKWDEVKLVHIAHGLIRDKEGKFSTRLGRTISLEKVLNEAIRKSEELMEKSETKRRLSCSEKKEIAHAIGIGGIKYNILSYHYSKDIIFDWEKILNLQGNSGPYLQYTYVRCYSIIQKAQKEGVRLGKLKKGISLNKDEIALLRTLVKFPDVVQVAAEKFAPNLLCDYLYNLSSLYNYFYQQFPILKVPEEDRSKRVQLTLATSYILRRGFYLLGMPVISKM